MSSVHRLILLSGPTLVLLAAGVRAQYGPTINIIPDPAAGLPDAVMANVSSPETAEQGIDTARDAVSDAFENDAGAAAENGLATAEENSADAA